MLKNYWYMIAYSVVISIIFLATKQLIIPILFFSWVFYLVIAKRINVFVFGFAFLVFIFSYLYIPSPSPSQTHSESHPEQVSLTGKIIEPIDVSEKKLEFVFQSNELNKKILVVYFKEENDDFTTEAFKDIRYGAFCTVNGFLSIPDGARNPHQFDYQNYLYKKGIAYQFILSSVEDISCQSKSYWDYIYSLRTLFIQMTEDKLQRETAGWLHALVLGQDDLLEDQVIELFQRWSLSHILAISGLHIGIVVGLLYVLCIRFSIITKEYAQWLIILFLPVYALLAGGQPSVWRASLMVLLGILLQKIKWKYSLTDIISIVFLLLIFLDKYIVYEIGFQFSFAVTFGLILSAKWIKHAKTNVERIFQISFVSQMMILPLQVHYFFTFQPLSILLNVVVVPYFSMFVIPLMFFFLMTIILPQVFVQPIEFLFLKIHHVFLTFVEFIDTYANFPLVIGEFSLYFTIIYYVLFFTFMSYLEQDRRGKAFQYGLLISICIVVVTLKPYFSPFGKVTMLDIGQGDSFIIELPYRRGVFMIDAGASFSYPDFLPTDRNYKQIIKPYLEGNGIHKIDTIFLSHEDADHVGSIDHIIEDIPVDEIIISEFYQLDGKVADEWQNKGAELTRVTFHDIINRKGQVFQVISPQKDYGSPNENSLILYTKIGGKSWIFTGDMGENTEKEILKNYPSISFDIIKVGHHGSNTSTGERFIETAKPDYALISVGRNNRYGHPAKEVIHRLEAEEIQIYRTDKHGATQYIFKDSKGMFSTFLKKP